MAVKQQEKSTQLEVGQDGLAVLTLDTEGKLNVLSPPVFEELDHRFRELADKPEVKALLIRSGKSGKSLSSSQSCVRTDSETRSNSLPSASQASTENSSDTRT